MEPSDPPTPRVAFNLMQGPYLRAIAEELAESLRGTALRMSKNVLDIDMSAARSAMRLRRDLLALAQRFDGWESVDPGVESRIADVVRLRELELRAQLLTW